MRITFNRIKINLSVKYRKNNEWIEAGDESPVRFTICNKETYYTYRLELNSNEPTQVRIYLSLPGMKDYYHLIPCNIYGDNNAKDVKSGEFPLLTKADEEDVFRSPFWEFRADRASTPVSAICTEAGAVAISIDPYSQNKNEIIHNGLFAELPDTCGVSLGYTNEPFSFVNKRTPGSSTSQDVASATVEGRIYAVVADDSAEPRQAIHKIIREEYYLRHERPGYKKKFREAVKGCLDSFASISWNPETEEYTNCNCLPPENTVLKPWRDVVEIGWTGGGVLAYPMLLSERILGNDATNALDGKRNGEGIFDRIVAAYNEKSGLINDLTRPIDESGSLVNGWWADFGLTKDVHCSYNVGSAVHYMLKAIEFLKANGEIYSETWLDVCRKTLDTVISLQREDGAFGYTYYIDHPGVKDWDGFAGCWFVPCCAYMYHLTGDTRYLDAADRGLDYYQHAVSDLSCCGTPMDTWKSPDQEGNLAFLRGARLLHEYTGKQKYLDYLKESANYEFLWRYGYRTKPDNRPLIDGWNSCGGSVTSVSNPHIHPMGMIVDSDLYYLGRVTGEAYYMDRAEDGTAWLMQTLELYPDKTGYGRYGVLSERWCPSDGLVIQRDSDGKPYSSWFSYNLWAASAAFEEVCERALETEQKKS
ncbi:MAG: hypothetical protein PHX95_07815 [Lachnospiraceae bacterium]|nr:hypothetical protein [Lachnospiraceae bacterium]